MSITKLKRRNIKKLQHKITARKFLLRLRDELKSSMKDGMLKLLNTPKTHHIGNVLLQTKVTSRMGWWWIKYRMHPHGRWGKYRKYVRVYKKPICIDINGRMKLDS